MNDQKPDKDPNKLSEEELQEILKKLKQTKKNKYNKNMSVAMGFLLHPNYVIHLLLSLGINLVIFATVLGLAIGINMPLVETKILGFLFAVVLLTFIENFVKILMFKYFTRVMILSMGLISVMIQILILYGIDLLLGSEFEFSHIERLIVFAFAFSLLRLLASYYARRLIYRDRIITLGD